MPASEIVCVKAPLDWSSSFSETPLEEKYKSLRASGAGASGSGKTCARQENVVRNGMTRFARLLNSLTNQEVAVLKPRQGAESLKGLR